MLRSLKVAVLIAAALAVWLSLDVSGLALRVPATSHSSEAETSQEASRSAQVQKSIDPAAWGANHVRKPVPEFVGGNECLFCHRNDIGPGWQRNAHGITVRQREEATEWRDVFKGDTTLSTIAAQVEYFMGSRHRVRFLKKEGYGKFAILNTQAELTSSGKVQKWNEREKPAWDKEKFANRCAGCHTTGVEPSTKSFSTFAVDCYACHAVVDMNHTTDISLVFLSKKRRNDARTITSTCAQCHLRNGKSKSTSLPYPNNFVPGDNLFQDYDVDLSKADDESLNAGDRHVFRNVREVVLYGSEFPTCISCHDLHKGSSLKHHRAPRTAICNDCHSAEGPIKGSKTYTVHSALCEY